MTPARFSFTAELREHDGPGAWYFVSLPEADADDIEQMFGRSGVGEAVASREPADLSVTRSGSGSG